MIFFLLLSWPYYLKSKIGSGFSRWSSMGWVVWPVGSWHLAERNPSQMVLSVNGGDRDILTCFEWSLFTQKLPQILISASEKGFWELNILLGKKRRSTSQHFRFSQGLWFTCIAAIHYLILWTRLLYPMPYSLIYPLTIYNFDTMIT